MIDLDKIPFFSAQIEDSGSGVFAISLVDYPAVEINWVAFRSQSESDKSPIMLSFNDDKHLLTGVIMVADTPIYRESEDGQPYFIVYTKDVIKQMAEKMLNRDRSFSNIDIQHNGEYLPEGEVELRELYIKDTLGGTPTIFDSAPEGSLVATYKVNNDKIWEECKSGQLNGFSLAGWFGLQPVENQALINSYKNTIKSKMKFKSLLQKILIKYSEVKTEDGAVWVLDGELTEGSAPVDQDGEAIPDGTYTVDSQEVTIKDGVVESIKSVEEPVVEPVVEPVEAAEDVPADIPAESAEEPTYATKADIEALQSVVEALQAKVDELSAKLAEPIAEPIQESYEKVVAKDLLGAAKFLSKLK